MTTEGEPLRIGNAERNAAMKALDEHLAAGRLGVDEYADRSAAAASATVAPELAALFRDLPAPHPNLPGAPPPPPPTAQLPVVGDGDDVAVPARSAVETWGPRLLPVVPLVAVALFFLTGTWVWFLLIPVAGAVFYGGRRGR
ncbi:DUF1707 domain-containing protein [Actinomycetes bacterium KLBMP 9759]